VFSAVGHQDAASGDFVFEAGAVVLADRGVCCVDEFDKLPGEHKALLEAMEQQQVRNWLDKWHAWSFNCCGGGQACAMISACLYGLPFSVRI
jgi:hypothetical protein